MDYRQVQAVLDKHGLNDNPAFKDVIVYIHDIPCFDGCPLGLYNPRNSTDNFGSLTVPPHGIVIPPTGSESTLLHELGHRHGHYHFNDLTEHFAELFRRTYDHGPRALLYKGQNLSHLARLEAVFDEGDRGAIEISFSRPLTWGEVASVRKSLHSQPEPPPRVIYRAEGTPFMRVEFTKGVGWLTIVGAAMGTALVATVGAVTYAVYKVSKELPWVVPVTIWGAVTFFGLRALAREAAKRLPERR